MSPITEPVFKDSTGAQNNKYEYEIVAVSKSDVEGAKTAGISVMKASAFICTDTLGGSLGFDLPKGAAANDQYYIVFDLVNPYPSAV